MVSIPIVTTADSIQAQQDKLCVYTTLSLQQQKIVGNCRLTIGLEFSPPMSSRK